MAQSMQFCKLEQTRALKEGQNEEHSRQNWTLSEELYGKPDINQLRKEVRVLLNKSKSMMCCCPESFVGKRFLVISVVNRMRS